MLSSSFSRGLSLTFNFGSLLLLGAAAGSAAGRSSQRRRLQEAAAREAAAAEAAAAAACDASGFPGSAAPSSPDSRPLRRTQQLSHWLSGPQLLGGARTFASLPCPLSDEEEDFHFDADDWADLRWQYLWQTEQDALLASLRRQPGGPAAEAAGVAAGTAATPPPAAAAAAASAQQQQQVPPLDLSHLKLHLPALSPQQPASAGQQAQRQQHGEQEPEAPVSPHPQPRSPEPRQQQAAAAAAAATSGSTPVGQLHLHKVTSGLGGAGASSALLPWERHSPEEQQYRLAAFRAEGQPYCKRSLHSLTLPFLLEAYSVASPPPKDQAVNFRPDLVRPRGRQPAAAAAQAAQQEQQAPLRDVNWRPDLVRPRRDAPSPPPTKDWRGGLPSVSIGQAIKKLFSKEQQAPLQQALARMDTYFTNSGAWKAGHGPQQLRTDPKWKAPSPSRAAKVVAFLLQEAGAEEEDVVAAIKSSPWLLGLDLEAHARPALQLLAEFGFEAAAQQQGQQQGQQAQQGQQQGEGEGASVSAGRMLTVRPLLMLLPAGEQLRPLLGYMASLGMAPAQMERLLRENQGLCSPEGLQRLRLVVSFLAGKGLTKDEVVHVINQVPRVVQYTPDSLQLKWQFMQEALGGSSRDIAACPYFLETSLYNVLGPRVAVAQAQGVPILLPSEVEGEGQRRGGIKRAAGVEDKESGISLWKLLRDSTSKVATKLGTTAAEFQEHVQHWQQHEWQRWQSQQQHDLEHYMQPSQRCCAYV